VPCPGGSEMCKRTRVPHGYRGRAKDESKGGGAGGGHSPPPPNDGVGGTMHSTPQL